MLLTYKALNGLAPDYITDLLNYIDSRRTLLRSSNHRLLDEPREKILKRMVRGLFPWRHQAVWNKLPFQIRLLSSEAVFKAYLKTYLFKRAIDL